MRVPTEVPSFLYFGTLLKFSNEGICYGLSRSHKQKQPRSGLSLEFISRSAIYL
jgi:hypothetical protein